MKIKKHLVVIGLGEFGSELARELAKQCEVLALDRDENKVNAVVDAVQRALILDVRDFNSLSSVVTGDFDEAIVGIGENLEASILCTLHLKKIGVKFIYAKAKTEDQASILRALGATETPTSGRLACLTSPPIACFSLAGTPCSMRMPGRRWYAASFPWRVWSPPICPRPKPCWGGRSATLRR